MTPEERAASMVTIEKRGTFSHLWRVQIGQVLVRDFAFEDTAEACAIELRQALAVAIREAVDAADKALHEALGVVDGCCQCVYFSEERDEYMAIRGGALPHLAAWHRQRAAHRTPS